MSTSKAELQLRVEELEARLDQVLAEHQEFRRKVVTEALKAAKQHHWCEVVRRTLVKMELGDLLPPRYQVQRKTSTGRWIPVSSSLDTPEEAGRHLRSYGREYRHLYGPGMQLRVVEKVHGKRLKVIR